MTNSTEDLWNRHSLSFLEMAFRNDHCERLPRPDGYGIKTGDCGDTIEFFLIFEQGRIHQMAYATNGCLNTNACANAVIELARGRSLEAAWGITPEIVAGFLQSLPENHFHCAELAVGALYLALSDAGQGQRHPWKKLYRKL
jgi:nitrogen fixation NifU-like protein